MADNDFEFRLEIPVSFRRRFRERCFPADNGCLIYRGGSTVRLPAELGADVEFVTPRRAAYIIEHAQVPDREVKLNCGTPGCVAVRHFAEGRLRRAGVSLITDDIRALVARDAHLSDYAAQRKYGLSRTTIRLIRAKEPKQPDPPARSGKLHRF